MTQDTEYTIYSSNETGTRSSTIQVRTSNSSQMYVIHKAVIKQLHMRRQGNANCRTRSEVRGGGRKPWKQKGTGRARAGSSRSPLWRGGGVIFGPKTKNYYKKVNKKERRLAISNALFNKKDFTIAIAPSWFDFGEPKTKKLLSNIRMLSINQTEKILIIMSRKRTNILLAARNLSNIEVIAADQINILSIIKAKYVLIDTDAIKTIIETYNG